MVRVEQRRSSRAIIRPARPSSQHFGRHNRGGIATGVCDENRDCDEVIVVVANRLAVGATGPRGSALAAQPEGVIVAAAPVPTVTAPAINTFRRIRLDMRRSF